MTAVAEVGGGEGGPGLERRLNEIECALDAQRYAPGPWQRFLEDAFRADRAVRRRLEGAATRTSDKLHRRRAPRTVAFERALALEILAALAGLALLAAGAVAGSGLWLAVSAIVLATALQPLLKVATGLTLGLRYSYAYLWHGEPRFKLAYGTYLAAPRWRRVALHASGALGSPLAWLLVAVVAQPTQPTLARVLWWLLAGHLLFQAVLGLLACAGVRRVPVLGLLRLTSPGAAGHELRGWRARAEAP